MDKDPRNRQVAAKPADSSPALQDRAALVEWLHARSNAARWGLSRERFALALERSVGKGLASGALTPADLEKYLAALHLEDLALACACIEGCQEAWEHFYATYRNYLRAAAAAILRRDSASAEVCELADSLFAELYGLAGGKGGERSLFRYFHGRSSLKTWLRAIIAQRHIDSIRAGRRFEELGEEDTQDARQKTRTTPELTLVDPHRQRYLNLFTRALAGALEQLEPQERETLRLYYAEEKTLAEIGRLLGEHESSVSRHLDRTRRNLREKVEHLLRQGWAPANGSAAQRGLSDAEIALCFEYCAEDSPIDLEKLLPRSKSPGPAAGKRPS
ncbi:MAG TPA: sigma-70 family RNA polymerase sigma factor [Candidatus Acidoferrum sp.]